MMKEIAEQVRCTKTWYSGEFKKISTQRKREKIIENTYFNEEWETKLRMSFVHKEKRF